MSKIRTKKRKANKNNQCSQVIKTKKHLDTQNWHK